MLIFLVVYQAKKWVTGIIYATRQLFNYSLSTLKRQTKVFTFSGKRDQSLLYVDNVSSWAKKWFTHMKLMTLIKILVIKKFLIEPSALWHCWFGGKKGIWPVKDWVVGCWCGHLSGARCRLMCSKFSFTMRPWYLTLLPSSPSPYLFPWKKLWKFNIIEQINV